MKKSELKRTQYMISDHEGREVAVVDKKAFEAFMRSYGGSDSAEAFFKDLIFSELPDKERARRAAELKTDEELKRRVYVIRLKNLKQTVPTLELLEELFPDDGSDVLFNNGNDEIVLVSEAKAKRADMIISMINTEMMEEVRVAFGKPFDTLTAMKTSYMQACIAMEAGLMFYEDRLSIGYDELGLGRIIYNMDELTSAEFMEEHFGEKKKMKLTEEELNMAGKFLERGLNLSETARDLFMHRNTLVYHLEKIQKKTGLDVRKFEDAVIFKIATMIERRG